ncbi:hypothetical protein [Streptomyces humidus]|uniref:hypothetical protein n=1 Tax=Streptomyces humidus TaxID=52259 RepID=UPI003D9ED061
MVTSRAGAVLRSSLPRRQLPRPRVAVGNVQPTSTPLPVNVFHRRHLILSGFDRQRPLGSQLFG